MYSYPRQVVAEQGAGTSVVARSLLWMVAGLLTTCAISLIVLRTLPAWMAFYSGWGPLVLVIAEFALVWYLSARLRNNAIAPGEAKALFLVYAASLGVVLVPLLAGVGAALVPALLVSAGMFAAVGIWGYTTRTDMRPMGTFLFMAVIGLLLAMLINAFLAHGALTFWVSVIGVLLFSGLTAYDVQRIRHMGFAGDGAAILGALALYLDFVNLFLFVLRLMTGRRR
jgi:FtsH-binding integral membrane protein